MKKVRVSYDGVWSATFSIRECEETLDVMRDQLLFWMGGQDKIDEADGNIEEAYLKWITVNIIPMSSMLNLKGIKQEFNNMEGFAPIDGEYGVELLSCDSWEFEEYNVEIEQI